MRNLLGRLHARRLPELLRIAEAWSVPLYVESKSEVVGALYRAMTDPRTMRDVWDRLDPARARDGRPHWPTRPMRQWRLPWTSWPPVSGSRRTEARETALRLYRTGILSREGDDEPLPIGAVPRLLLPRELALQVRRIQDEMAAGNLAQSPLRVLLELLDDAELEAAAKIWGLRTVPGVARRRDLAARLLRLSTIPPGWSASSVAAVATPWRSGRSSVPRPDRCPWPRSRRARGSVGRTRSPSPGCVPRWPSSKGRCSSGTPTRATGHAGCLSRRKFVAQARGRLRSSPSSSRLSSNRG